MVKTQKPRKSKVITPLKLDLGCGQNKQDGFTGVDLYAPGADVRCDLFQTPFSRFPDKCDGVYVPARHSSKNVVLWNDNTVDEIFCSHFVEHIPNKLRWQFFEECWRIMKLEATMRIFVPSWKSERAYGDMTHEWPAVTAFFFYYLSKDWREANKLTYGPYDLKCNFDSAAGPTQVVGAIAERAHEAQVFACTHYLEAYPDMWVTLTKKAP